MDPHSVLGVSRSASKEEVKTAWRKAVRESHPDLHTNSPEHIQQKANERFKAVQDAYDRITSGRAHVARQHRYQRSSSSYGGQQSGKTDWAHVRNAHAYRRHTGYGTFASWFNSSRAYTTPRAVRQQATLVVAAIAAMMTLDAVTNAVWNKSNEGVENLETEPAGAPQLYAKFAFGRLYGNVAQEAQERLQAKVKQRDVSSQHAPTAAGASSDKQPANREVESHAAVPESSAE